MHPDNESNNAGQDYERARLGRGEWLLSWWREATAPINWDNHLTPARAIGRRVLQWVPVAALLLTIAGAAGFYFFTGWRAHDLAGKAMENAKAGNLNLARVQILSAQSLRRHSPEVKQAAALVRSRFNDAQSPALWEELAAEDKISPEDAQEWARVALATGNDASFDKAMAWFEGRGDAGAAAALRAKRSRQSGNLGLSITEARTAAETGGAEGRLALVRLLVERFGPSLALGSPPPASLAAAREIEELIEALAGTPQQNEALALTLGAVPLDQGRTRAWAGNVLAKPSPQNPALFPAADYVISTGAAAADYLAPLSAALAGSPPGLQAKLAQWLTRHGMAEEAAQLITAKKASSDAEAYLARAEALENLGRWEDLSAMTQSAAPVPAAVRLGWQSLAAAKAGKKGAAEQSLGEALRSAQNGSQVAAVLTMADRSGQGAQADEVLIALCADTAAAGAIFPLVRERFGRAGRHHALERAFGAASASAPTSWAVVDQARRLKLLAGQTVDPAETAAAVQEQPANQTLRFTHALALLQAGRPGDALGVFHDIDILVTSLPPADQAVVVAVYEANGLSDHAQRVRSVLDAEVLPPAEYRLTMPMTLR